MKKEMAIKIIAILIASFLMTACQSIQVNEELRVKKNLSPTKNIILETGNTLPVRVRAYYETQKPAPTIIVGHGSGGVTIVELGQAIDAKNWGYNTVVVDHYTGRGIERHTGKAVDGAYPTDRASDMLAVAKWVQLQSWHNGKIGIIGVSQGGAGLWILADKNTLMRNAKFKLTEDDLNLFSFGVAMYPACAPSFASPPAKPSFPIQLHLAGADDLALPQFCNTFGNEMYEKHIYENATHSFNWNVFITGLKFTHKYDQKADELSQARIKAYVDKQMK